MNSEITTEQWELLQTKVRSAARRVASQWPDVIEAEDLAQDMIVGLMERPGVLARFFEENEQVQGSFLIKFGHQIASDEQIDYDRFSGNYLYNSAEIRGMLERGVLQTDDHTKWTPEESDLYEGMANLADSGSAYYADIVNRWVYEIVPDWQDKTAHSRISRAIDSLTERMNRIGAERRKRWIEGPGSRRVMSNIQSQAHTATQGDFDA